MGSKYVQYRPQCGGTVPVSPESNALAQMTMEVGVELGAVEVQSRPPQTSQEEAEDEPSEEEPSDEDESGEGEP